MASIIGRLNREIDHDDDHALIGVHVRAFYAECDVPKRDRWDRRRDLTRERAIAAIRAHMAEHHDTVDVPAGSDLETLRDLHEEAHRR